MSAGAFLGLLVALDPRAPGQTMLATVALPRGECDAVIKTLGPPDPVLAPNVALLPALRPDHPRSADDAALLAALRFVNSRLPAAGLRPELLHELGVLRATLAGARRPRDITRPASDAALGMF